MTSREELELLDDKLESFFLGLSGQELLDQAKKMKVKTHPDVCDDKELASKIFTRIPNIVDEIAGKREYTDLINPFTIRNSFYENTFNKKIGSGQVTNIFSTKHDLGLHYAKVAKHPANSNIVEKEYLNLKKIFSKDCPLNSEFIPYPLVCNKINTSNGKQLSVAVYKGYPFNSCTLQELRNSSEYKDGIPLVHSVWIIRRIMKAQQAAYTKDIIHPAPTPNHILIFPEERGAMLIDWSLAGRGDSKLIYYPKYWKNFLGESTIKSKKITEDSFKYCLVKTMDYCEGSNSQSHWKHLKDWVLSVPIDEMGNTFLKEVDKVLKRQYVPLSFKR